jgi:hypothetical protein
MGNFSDDSIELMELQPPPTSQSAAAGAMAQPSMRLVRSIANYGAAIYKIASLLHQPNWRTGNCQRNAAKPFRRQPSRPPLHVDRFIPFANR